MKKECTYSFVIPHHNTPDLLQRLIDSIPQREDIEIIVVDDNSDEDKKANVTRADVKTIFIDKEHTKGAGRARNVGMDAATGKWLLFADADDFYKPNFIKVLDEYKDDDIEMLFFNVESADVETQWRANNRQILISRYDGTAETTNNLLYFTYAPWTRMFRTDFIRKYKIRYEEIARTNDVFFSLQTSYFAKKWKVDTRTVYIVCYFRGSLSNGKITKAKYKDQIQTYKRISEFYNYIGHAEWNRKSVKGKYSQSPYKRIIKIWKSQPLTGIEALLYYWSHWLIIKKKSYYYVDVIRSIEKAIGE